MYSKLCVKYIVSRFVLQKDCSQSVVRDIFIKVELSEWFVKCIEVGVGLQRDCSQRAPSDGLDSHGGRVFLPIVEDDDDQK